MPEPGFSTVQADLIEYFAGKAKVARLAQTAGWASLAHDIDYDPTSVRVKGKKRIGKSCMDLNENAGYACFGLDLGRPTFCV